MSELLPDLIFHTADHHPERTALVYGTDKTNYSTLAHQVRILASGLVSMNLKRSERVAIFLEKRPETIVSLFGIAAAGGVFVPINPVLKPGQIQHILHDSQIKILITSKDRWHAIKDHIEPSFIPARVILIDHPETLISNLHRIYHWDELMALSPKHSGHRVINTDMVAILYTSGSTGRPKGVVLSHLNLVEGAKSVASYLDMVADDRLLALLPLSFDYGLNQITTAFLKGAQVVLMNYFLAGDVIRIMAREHITGLAAVPPLWNQLANVTWHDEATRSLRYFTNSGGSMPRPLLDKLRLCFPMAKPFLMYGLTEAFRSTYLPPDQIDQRPGSIGKAIPNAEVLVVRADGTLCVPHETGELVHRGVHVSMGYWNDPIKTAERFKPLPSQPNELPLTEMAVWSGDSVRQDEEGFLYFVGRRDDMIKTSGYRVSPTEIEELIYATHLVNEVVAMGIPHEALGQAILLWVSAPSGADIDIPTLWQACRQNLPSYMVPTAIHVYTEPTFPRGPNGKIDRQALIRLIPDLNPTKK